MRKTWALFLLLAALGASLASWRTWRHPEGPERLLLVEPVPGAGMDEPTAESLGSLLTDELETRAGLAVTNVPAPGRAVTKPSTSSCR